MASSATQNIQNSAPLHALHARAHGKPSPDKTSSGDKFADMLADADAAQDAKPAAPKSDAKETDKPEAADKTDAKDEAGNAPARTDKAETGKDAPKTAVKKDGKDGDKKEDIAANDNGPVDATVNIAQPAQPQQALLQLALDGSRTKGDAAKGEAQDEAVTAGVDAPKTGDATADPGIAAAPKDAPKTAPDFEKALHQAKAEAPTAAPDAAVAKPASDFNNIALVQPAAAAPATPAADKLVTATPTGPQAAPLPTPDVNQFAVDIAAKSQSGAKQFDIRLDPPELGRVEVRLSIDATGKAEAHLTADKAQTLDLLRRDSTSLTQALRDAGLNVAQDGLNFSLRNPHSGSNDQSGERQAHAGRPGFAGKNSTETVPPEASAYVRRALGVVDIKV